MVHLLAFSGDSNNILQFSSSSTADGVCPVVTERAHVTKIWNFLDLYRLMKNMRLWLKVQENFHMPNNFVIWRKKEVCAFVMENRWVIIWLKCSLKSLDQQM